MCCFTGPNPSVSSSPETGTGAQAGVLVAGAPVVRGLHCFPMHQPLADEDKETVQQRSEKAELDQTDKHPINLKVLTGFLQSIADTG